MHAPLLRSFSTGARPSAAAPTTASARPCARRGSHWSSSPGSTATSCGRRSVRVGSRWSSMARRFSRRTRIRSVTNGPPGTSQRHEWHERPGHGEHVPPAIGAGDPVPRLRDVLRRRHRAVSRLWQPDVGLGCSLSCQEPRDKPPVSCTSRSDGATDRPAVGTRRLFGGNSTQTGACLCWRLRALKRPWPSSLTIRRSTLPSRRRNKRRR